MALDLNDLTRELETLITRAKRRKETLKKRKPIATVRAKIKAAAEAEGYPSRNCSGRRPGRRHPQGRQDRREGPQAGQGAAQVPQPRQQGRPGPAAASSRAGLAAEIAKGKKLEDFLIRK